MSNYKGLKTAVVVLTLNPGDQWQEWIKALNSQDNTPDRVLVIDSSSEDMTVETARASGFDVVIIQRDEFNHGATRLLATTYLDGIDIAVFMTQDAILVGPYSLSTLVSNFDDEQVAIAYGRQLPRPGTNLIESHARLFNYPTVSRTVVGEDIKRLGIKAAFCSNSFAAYRISLLKDVGNFPVNVIFGEDMYVAARVLLAGYKVNYVAESTVYHSHGYSMSEEFKRYFDIGVFHSRESWIIKSLGKPQGEGKKFVKSELKFLFGKRAYLRALEAFMRSVLKYMGYFLGRNHKLIPKQLCRLMSMNQKWWNTANMQ